MRIVHLADTHLGFRQLHRVNDAGRNVREQDVYAAWDQAISKTIALRPDALVHAGDLFDSYHPSTAALMVALDGLRRLDEAGIPVVMIAGNHSTPRAAAAEHIFGVLERLGNVHVVYGGTHVVRIEGPGGPLAVQAIAHDNDAESMAAALRAARVTDSRFNVLVTHVGLDGLGQVAGAEAGSVTLSGETLADAGDFDYIALGHLHKFAPARENAAYSGSLERLSWADDAPHKGIVEVDLAAGRFSGDYLRLHPLATRAHLTLPAIDAAQTEDLTAAILARAEEVGEEKLRGSMVRLAIRGVSAANWNAVDYKAVAAAYAECLHFERELQMTSGSVPALAAPQVREFLLAWATEHAPRTPGEELIARAETFLAQADQELAG